MDNIFDDPKLDDEEFEDMQSHNPSSAMILSTTANNTEAAGGGGESTSPYARANMQLPKKHDKRRRRKESRPWRQVIKELVTGHKTPVASGIPGENGARIIHINQPHLNDEQKFLNNSVRTGKYSIFNFIPKFLYEEFSKYANLFFLFISIIQVSYSCKCVCNRNKLAKLFFYYSKFPMYLLLQDGLPLYH